MESPPPRVLRRAQHPSRFTAQLLVFALLAQVLTLAALAAPRLQDEASAAPGLQLSKDAPDTVLAGQQATYRVTASNPGDAVEYNVSISDPLPFGATYVPGSVSPSSAGEPAVSVDPNTGRQVLAWANLTDLYPNGNYTLSFGATLGADGDVVGGNLLNTSYVAAQTDPREVPRFDSGGVPVPGTYTESATASKTTVVTAVKITKSSTNTREGELLRGVHDQRSVYTLTVTNTPIDSTNLLTVTDMIPAGMEFLNCGDVDHTQPGSQVEYPGAPRLGVPSVNPGAACVDPIRVETVTDPPPGPGVAYPPGVYTKVQWRIAALGPGEVRTIQYVAGIPLRANTGTWTPGPAPDPASLQQGSNLDNNNGASTRELATEQSLQNFATVSGFYQGQTVDPTPFVFDNTTHSVQVEDVRMRKQVSPSQFAQGGIATFSLTVDTSEYVTGSSIVITDLLPDGYCPLSPGDNYAPGSPAECGTGGSASSVPFQSVTYDPTSGAYSIEFAPLPTTAANGTTTVTFTARMRTTYTGTDRGDVPTVAGDSFRNTVSLSGTTTPVPGTGESGPQTVGDTSSATQTTPGPNVVKEMKPRYIPMDCNPAVGQPYGDPSTFTPPQKTFRQGDLLCFRLRAVFPASVSTRAPVITDFFPVDTRYVVSSMTPTTNNTATIASFTPPGSAPGSAVWTLGDDVNGTRFVGPGKVFEVVLAATVLEPAAPPKPDLLGNLLKARYQNSSGEGFGARDDVNFDLAPASNVTLSKGVYQVNAPANGPNPPDQDGKLVQEDSAATFRIDITNLGRSDFPGANFSIRGVQTWDVLPPGISCSAISNLRVTAHGTSPSTVPLSPAPASLDPASWDCQDAPHPTIDIDPSYGSPSQSVIVWHFPDPDLAEQYSVFVGQTMTLLYDMRIPAQTSVSTRFDNTAAIRSFQSFTNIANTTSSYFPADNIDAGVPPAEENAQAADDPSWVTTADASIAKTVSTRIGESNNNVPNQATIGELVDYTVSATVPAHTTVYNGRLSDPMPTGLTFVSADGSLDGGALPPGFTLTGGNPSSIGFPATWQNTTNAPQVFQMAITARMNTAVSNTNGTNRTNTATFASTTDAGGGTPITPRTAQASVRVVEPNPTITKSVSPEEVIGGQTVTYQLVAGNANGRPPSHDTLVVDCLPAQVAFAQVKVNQGGTVTTGPGGGANPCAIGQTFIRWEVGSVLAGTANRKRLEYTATIDPSAVGGDVYTNTATLTGTSLDNGFTPDPNERTYTRNSSAQVRVTGQDVTKGVFPDAATIGEVATYDVTTRIPANTQFFQVALTDVIPVGLAASGPDFTTVSVTCQEEVTNSDCLGTITPTTPRTIGQPLTPAGQTVGWYLGDIATSTSDRFVTVTYRTVVRNVGANQAGDTRTNSANAHWSTNPAQTPPGTVGQAIALGQHAGPATAGLSVLEPQLSIAKDVSNAQPDPGDTFDYSVTVTNDGGPNASEAFEVGVTDAIPTGVVVDPSSISNGGSLSGTDVNGSGGTITWTGAQLGSLAPGEPLQLTYSATFVASPQLAAGAKTNTASVSQYFSLPTGNPERRAYSGPSDTATVTPRFPRFTVDKSTVGAPDSAQIGEPFGWRFTVANSGAGDGFAVDAVDTLPPNWTYEPGSATLRLPSAGPAVPLEPVVTNAGAVQTLTWTDFGDLAAGQDALIQFNAVPTAAVVTSPGVGLSVAHTNTVTAAGEDVTGATGNAGGSYSGGPDSAAAYIPSADLQLTKVATSNPVTAGGTATWTLTVANNGPDFSVAPFRVVDTLPAGVTFNSASGMGWTCAVVPGGDTIGCTRSTPATLAGGASLPPITVVGNVPSGVPAGTTFDNTAEVFPTTYDPDPSNNTDHAEVVVDTSADLAITKTTLTSPVVAGSPVQYTLRVDNLGPSDSSPPILVTDPLPAGLTPTSATGTDWVCVFAGRNLLCVRDQAIEAGQSAPLITVTADLARNATGSLSNTATVTPTTPDPSPGNNTSTVTDPVTTSADLAITKRTTSPVVAGRNVAYALSVTNNGPSDSLPVIRVTDTLPAGLSFVSATGTDWTCSALLQVITCDRTTALAATATAPTIDVTAAIDPGATGNVVNPADVIPGPTPDPIPGNNHSQVTDPLVVQADLAITKTHTPEPAALGGSVDFTLQVTNLGPSTATGVTVDDALPAGLTPTAATGPGWTCTITGQAVACDLGANLAPGPATPITVSATVGPAAAPSVLNNATVDATTTDPDPGNNTARDTVTVPPSVDLTIDKSHTGNFTVGTQGTFALTVGNNGPTRDPGPVTVTDTLPTGLSFVSATGVGWTCGAVGQVVTCTNPTTLEAGATSTITLVVDVLPAAYPQVTNPASVTSPATDTNPSNNSDTDTVTVVVQVDLSLTKTGSVTSGNTATWTIVVANAGPGVTAGPITVTDQLPAGLAYRSADGPGWTCSENAGLVTCTYAPSLSAGSTATITLVTTITTTDGSSIRNVATASTPGEVDSATIGAGRIAPPGAGLAFTGTYATQLALIALALLLTGWAALWAAPRGGLRTRRRRR